MLVDDEVDDLEKSDDFLSVVVFLLSPPPKLKFVSRKVSELSAVSPLPEEELESFNNDFDVWLDLLELLLRSRDFSVLLEVDAVFDLFILLAACGSAVVD